MGTNSQKKILDDIFIVDGARTAIGSTFKALKNFSPAELAALTMKGLLKRNNVKGEAVSEVILGNTVSTGTGQNLARHASFLSGLPASTPAFTVNLVCGSGLQSLILGLQAIAAGDADVVLAGGSESSSQSPYFVKKDSKEKKEENFKDSLVYDGLTCQITGKHMGELAEYVAGKFKVSRKDQDKYTFESHKKACAAQEKGNFSGEIIPVDVAPGQIFKEDQRPRKNIDLEKLANLPPAFEENGTVTAGNSSIPSDGAAALLLASGDAVKKYKLTPRARILGYASIAIEPEMVFTASIPAVGACLSRTGLAPKDVDLFEISEAFAVQAIITQKELRIPLEKMNIFGGDVALGHPLGAAGARILVTLLHAMKGQKKQRGLATVCLGGGGAVAVLIEAIS